MSLDVMRGATLSQVLSFSPAAVSAFSGEVFITLALRMGGPLCDALRIPVTRVDAAADFVALLTQQAYSYSYNISASATDASWLQIAFAANGAEFILHNYATLQASAFQGIRPGEIRSGDA